MADDLLFQALAYTVGDGHVLAEPGLRLPYERDFTGRYGAEARAVVRPDDAEELAHVQAAGASSRRPGRASSPVGGSAATTASNPRSRGSSGVDDRRGSAQDLGELAAPVVPWCRSVPPGRRRRARHQGIGRERHAALGRLTQQSDDLARRPAGVATVDAVVPNVKWSCADRRRRKERPTPFRAAGVLIAGPSLGSVVCVEAEVLP